MAGGSFFAELRRRKVFRAAAIYGAVAWGLTEVIVTVVEQLFLPKWVATLTVIVFVVGFPIAMFLAWTFDITSDGIQRTEISSRRGTASIALSVALVIAGTAGLFLLIKPTMDLAEQGQLNVNLVPNSVAVLPFENISRREDDFYLSEGLGDELRDQLGRVDGLQIAARSSSIAIRNQAVGAVQMAATLGVAFLIEGSLRRSGRDLSISVQLIDGSTGLAVWSGNYQRGKLEMLEVQQDIANQVIAVVFPDEPDIRLAAPATLNASANDLMLLARHYENQVRSRQVVDTETLLEAIRLYRAAAVADPNSALVQSRLSGALLYLGDIEAAESAIFKALSLDPDMTEVQNTLGEYYWARGDPEAATAFRKAVDLNPNNADALHNYATLIRLNVDTKPDELFRRAVELDPLNLFRHAALGDYLGQQGRVEDVRQIINNIRSLFNDAGSYRAVGRLYELVGEVDLAIVWTLRARNLEPNNPDHVQKLAALFALIGDANTALKLESPPSLNTLLQLGQHDELIDHAQELMLEEPDDITVRYMLALSYVATGALKPAIHVLTSTGLDLATLDSQVRSLWEIEASMNLLDALAGSGVPEFVEIAHAMATRAENDAPWSGDVGWWAVFRSCNYAILGRHDEALALLPRIKESRRLRYYPILRDSWCFRQYAKEPAYLDAMKVQEQRRARLREKLPATLAEYGVKL